MKTLVLLFLALVINPANADTCVCKEFGFIVEFPQKHEKTEVKSPQGPLASFASVDPDQSIINTVTAQRILFLNESDIPAIEEKTKKFISRSLSEAIKIQGGSEVQSTWEKGTAWPVLKVSFKSTGFLGEGVIHYESGYWFLVGNTLYRVIAKGLKKDGLDDAATRLYGTFVLPDSEMLERAADLKR